MVNTIINGKVKEEKELASMGSRYVLSRGLIGGAFGGMMMGIYLMAYMAVTGMGFFSPLNIGLASFFYTVTPPQVMLPMLMKAMGSHVSPTMMTQIMAIKTGHATNSSVASLMKAMPSGLRNSVMASMPVNVSHVLAGMASHLVFSMMVGVAFVGIYSVARKHNCPLIHNRSAIIAGATLGSISLFLINDYVVLPSVAPMMTVVPAFPFLIAHIIFGLSIGAVLSTGLDGKKVFKAAASHNV